jgi:hypothetical protein
MLTAIIKKEWAEVRRPGRGKVEDWSWTVIFYDGALRLDEHYYKTEADAKMVAALFEAGEFHHGAYGEVVIDEVFANV